MLKSCNYNNRVTHFNYIEMNSIYNFIISTDQRYNNSVDVEGKELIVNTEVTERDAEFVNRVGTVAGTPLAIETPIKHGDEVIVHHNVFRRWYDQRGNEKNGGAYIDEGRYVVSMDQVYAYRKPGQNWIATPGFCFVEPIENPEELIWDINMELPRVGYIRYGSEQLGLDTGDLIGFDKGSEYEFRIGEERLYRIYSNDIIWTSKKNVNELFLPHN